MDRPTLVTANELAAASQSTPGVARLEAFADEHVWVGRFHNTPRQESAWHTHPGHDTYAYGISGRFCIDFGPGGAERIEVGPGDFALVPKGVVHRETNPGDDPNEGIVFRVGGGPVIVNLDGPEE